MAIEINNIVNTVSQRTKSAAEQTESERAHEGRTNDAPLEADDVRISADAHSFAEIQSRIDRAEPFDEGRVEAIRAALSRGDYPIDESKLAESFWSIESLLYQ